jgi:uncharacterized protein
MGRSRGRSHQLAAASGGVPAARLLAGLSALLLIVTACASAGPAAEAGARAPAVDGAPAERVRVLFLGDNGHHQPWQRVQIAKPAMAARGIDLAYTDLVSDLREDVLARYDVLMIYGNQARMTDEQLNAMLGFVRGGGGLVAVHSASAAFQDHEEFVRLIGGAFKSHGVGTFRTTTVAPEHPAIRGVPEFESWDETYVHSKVSPDNEVLAVRRDEHGEEPWTWVRTYGDGRIFYTAWGHDQRTWSNEGFQQLLAQGTQWAAGDWALDIRPREPQVAVMELETPLPYYPAGERWGVTGEPIRQAPQPLPAAESRELIVLPPGFRAELFASEPMVVNPIEIQWDERGRLWALETVDYPNEFTEDRVGNDRLVVLEDTNGDGRADRRIVFADGLNIPTSFVFANGGVIVAHAPDFLFLRDSTGDGQADVREVLFTGWKTFDTHAGPSNLRYGPDNHIWGVVGYSGFEGTVGGEEHDFAQGFYRFTRDGSRLEFLAPTSNNTWGLGFGEDGSVFGSTANGNPSVYLHMPNRFFAQVNEWEPTALPTIANSWDIFPIRADIRQVDHHGRYTAAAGHEVYTARAFPRQYWNSAAFVAEPTGHLLGYFELTRDGSGFAARNRTNMLASRDSWSAPILAKVGPDGMLWVVDWYNLIIQHNPTPEGFQRGEGNAYVSPNRDRDHGRIYRIVYDGAPPSTPLRLDDATPTQLVDALTHDNMFWRLTAQRLLVESGDRSVVPALTALIADPTIDELGLNPGALHAIWTLDGLGLVGSDQTVRNSIRGALYHPSAAVRRAALEVLPRDEALMQDMLAAGLWPDRSAPPGTSYVVPTARVMDADAQVRLAAVLAVAEMQPSPRIAEALADLAVVPENARDRWIPDAIAAAAARSDERFLPLVLERRQGPTDSAYVAGVQHVIRTVARHHAARSQDPATTVGLLQQVPSANEAVAVAYLEGLAEGWPEGQAPTLSAAQRANVTAIHDGLPESVATQLREVGARWGMPDLFRAPPQAAR